ncbi:MAG: ABC transporter substrate-binding protein [Oscillospiraceae bacterium]|jgi:branched-chain amino acid transport system substrate-binding protein|nr:ABC transporter substrate-binding protein [Oscillospiraceae bacterium]
MKKFLAFLLAVMMLAALVACGTKSALPDTTPKPGSNINEPDGGAAVAGAIKIGGTGPLTGGAAIYGQAARNGAQIAVDEINALGGVQFELNYQDDEHDAEKAVNAYNTLKDWGMQVSLGSVTSTPAVATSVENFEDRIFAITPSASAVAVTAGKDNVFQMCFADPNQGSASAQYIVDQKLGTKVAVIYKNDDVYSTGIYETFVTKSADLGLEIVSTTTFTEDSQQDFSVQLGDAKSKGADLIFLPMYYTPASLIFQQAKSMDYAPKYFGVDGMDGILTLEGFNIELAEGVMLLTPFNADATDARTTGFVAKYKSAYNEVPNQFAADGYDCVYAIYEAVTAAGVTSDLSASEINDLLVAQFTTFSFNGLTGDNMTWGTNGQVTKAPKGMVIENGAYLGMD